MKIFLATNNRQKGEEIISIFGKEGDWEFLFPEDLGLRFSVVEDGSSFAENAYKKAMTGFLLTGLPTMGEDSGLLIDYLKGLPGIKSHRFAGKETPFQEKIEGILKLLKGIPREERRAIFKCTICFVFSFKKILFFEGLCEGSIAFLPKGKFGFGYDPIFIPRGLKKTFGELGPEIKNKVSHRAEAVRKLKKYLSNLIISEGK
ncbi:MAG: RdgB/HAM1 family non-canonical purine NTP pyrophosphatase [candidate division WOR-3 bacterium]